MSVIIVLILVSIAIAVSFLAAFIWASKSGQFEDTFTPSLRILNEERDEK
jgi:cbb3-type cytochrome oxidase maturation protein